MGEPTEADRQRAKRHVEQKFEGGRSKHVVGVETEGWYAGVQYTHAPLVYLANDDDSYYIQYFRGREEVEAFIKELRAAANAAWTK